MSTLNTRISLRYDTYENWSTTSGEAMVLNVGEVGICARTFEGASQPTIMFKVGNGVSTFKELPWTSGLAADVYSWAKASKLSIIEEGEGEVITNISWDDASHGIKITRKTLQAEKKNFAIEGMVASYNNGMLTFTNARTAEGITSVQLV